MSPCALHRACRRSGAGTLCGARHGNGTDGATGDDSTVHSVCRGRWSDDIVQQLAWLRDVTLRRREEGRKKREKERWERERGGKDIKQDEYID